MTSSRQANWETNVYVLTTTRVFVAFGLTYLVKSSYQLYRRLSTSNDSTDVLNRMIGSEEREIGLELSLNGFLSDGAAAFGLGDTTDGGEMVEVRLPLPVYHPGSPGA